MTRPDVSVVVVSHNNARYLTACLDSLAPERHSLQLEVFVVDNLSADETVPLVRERYSWVGLMENSRRQGFAANINQAIRRSSGRYVLVLKRPTEVRLTATGLEVRGKTELVGKLLREHATVIPREGY